MRNRLGKRVLRRAWTVRRLTGSLRFPRTPNLYTDWLACKVMGTTDAWLAIRLKQLGRAASYILSEGLDRGWRASTQQPLRCRPACFLPASGQAAEVKVNDGRGVEGQQLTQRKADNGVTSGRRSSEPAPKLSISGMPPSSGAIVVIMIGRNRSRQAR